ncbi:XRE family transcriptional regulator [Streptomyces qinglanensis]|uniref:XRE family transcriptional regulator n=1 Tax=Streptomyces qinglanensis TaxID=943816 RepID=A0A1E7K6Y1_9ACTN|nr:helix-turn-helix transcriptional regulator [Streptomyces qinglanensis]OEU99671.1 XRE family transcriptional regulator [Streptomyces qinglanensis]OEV25249.1 XRE family transcriptional regulator [Streptomyces nanshensis]
MTLLSGTHPDAPSVGTLLRGWRERAALSQLELALRADSSARHISFIETGRTAPSREMVLKLAATLDVPVRERNTLLLSAGFAPAFAATPLDDPALQQVRGALERMVAAYQPYPALVLDGCYTVVAANTGLAALLEGVAPHLLEPPLNAMRITLHPEGLAPRIRNLAEWRGHLLDQMSRQLALHRSPALRALHDEVAAYPVPGADAAAPGDAAAPVPGDQPQFALPLVIEHGGQTLSFLSTIATFNTPLDVTVSELAVETFLLADPATAKALHGTG